MKHTSLTRFLSLLCAVSMLLFLAVPALAETIDLSRLTDAEITGLLSQVNQAIADRGIEKTARLAKGAYTAGKELPAGTYVYTCLATGSDWGNVTIYTDGGKGSQLLWEVVKAPEEGHEPDTIFMTLNEGDQLKSDTSFTLTIVGGVRFE